jgi:hypothetical protein
LAVRHPLVIIAILFILLTASLALGAFLGLPRTLGRYWGKEVYIVVFGGAFVYLTLSDRRRKKFIGHRVSSDDTGVLQRTQALSSQIDDKLRLDDFK